MLESLGRLIDFIFSSVKLRKEKIKIREISRSIQLCMILESFNISHMSLFAFQLRDLL